MRVYLVTIDAKDLNYWSRKGYYVHLLQGEPYLLLTGDDIVSLLQNNIDMFIFVPDEKSCMHVSKSLVVEIKWLK